LSSADKQTNTLLLGIFDTCAMNNDGLEKSIWAPRGASYSSARPGDWTCLSCGVSNFAWRKSCFRCPPVSTHETTHLSARSANANPNPNLVNHSKNIEINQQSTFQDKEDKKQGLCTSRWAPRNYDGRTTTRQIWTRVSSISSSSD